MSFYTENGLDTLAKIVKDRRGKRSLREFAKLVGVTHKTIDRIECKQFKTPSNQVLARLAPYLGLSLENLITILTSTTPQTEVIDLSQGTPGKCKQFCSAEDLIPLIERLPRNEVEKIFNHIKNILN